MRHNREHSILPLTDSIFGGLFSEVSSAFDTLTSLPMDVFFKEDVFHLRGPLPGVSLEDVHIWVEDDSLYVKGEIKPDIDLEESQVYRREVKYGFFERKWKLPKNVDKDRIQASIKNGILNISIPVTDSSQDRIKNIPINTD